MTISLCHLHTWGQEKAWLRRELQTDHLVLLHDPLQLLCSADWGNKGSGKGQKSVSNSVRSTELSAARVTEMAKTGPLLLKEGRGVTETHE